MSKKGNCSAVFKIAAHHGGHFHMLLMSRSCSSSEGLDEEKIKEMGWGYGDEEENEEEAHGD